MTIGVWLPAGIGVDVATGGHGVQPGSGQGVHPGMGQGVQLGKMGGQVGSALAVGAAGWVGKGVGVTVGRGDSVWAAAAPSCSGDHAAAGSAPSWASATQASARQQVAKKTSPLRVGIVPAPSELCAEGLAREDTRFYGRAPLLLVKVECITGAGQEQLRQ
jgi:hypothetical protein